MKEYVKTLSSLMLDIKNMSEEDKLFNFMSGLQPWAPMELKRQAVRDLPTTMSVADALMDYKFSKPSGDEEKRKSKDKGKDKQKKEARRRISRRKRGVTRAKERVLPLNQAKNSLSLMLATSFAMALIMQETIQSVRSLMPLLLKMVVGSLMKKFPAE